MLKRIRQLGLTIVLAVALTGLSTVSVSAQGYSEDTQRSYEQQRQLEQEQRQAQERLERLQSDFDRQRMDQGEALRS